ncbi:MAG: DUF4154 domain-containing protein [Deltaproteobacteria bacterium]|nr:DUF4154 domain-containing protein [Deltaproteobacteria bacterium]
MARNKPTRGAGYGPATSGGSPNAPVQQAGAGRPLKPSVLGQVVRSFRYWKLCPLFFAVFYLALAPVFAQVSKEYQLKAVFLWRLAQFTQWPSNAFEDASSPIFICVLGENPFGDALDEAVRGETAHARKFVVRHYRTVQEIKTCHILYISGSAARQIKEIIAALRGRSILTVSDIEGFTLSHDGMVRFLTEQNKIKLRVNVKAATAARLALDPRLLRAAEIVRDQ